ELRVDEVGKGENGIQLALELGGDVRPERRLGGLDRRELGLQLSFALYERRRAAERARGVEELEHDALRRGAEVRTRMRGGVRVRCKRGCEHEHRDRSTNHVSPSCIYSGSHAKPVPGNLRVPLKQVPLTARLSLLGVAMQW